MTGYFATAEQNENIGTEMRCEYWRQSTINVFESGVVIPEFIVIFTSAVAREIGVGERGSPKEFFPNRPTGINF